MGATIITDAQRTQEGRLPGSEKQLPPIHNLSARLERACASSGTPAAAVGGKPQPLLFDDAAGDAIARVARRIGHQIICFCVDDQRRAAFMEERICAFAESYTVGDEGSLGFAVLVHNEIGQIAEMRVRSLLAVDAVMGHGGIEVSTRGSERRPFALANIVNVNSVLTRRKLRYAYGNFHAIFCGRNLGAAYLHALCVHDAGLRRFRRGVAECYSGGEAKERG